ncbi:uncharacterized protein LOC135121135 [Zophobas morio]|uniref:uncharacterized protein LOC135121135 n=1 Tax=Zophobas morio TaxID=2755281 RepID=UPI003082C9BF
MNEETYNSHVRVLKQTKQIVEIQTIIRSKETSRSDFIFYSDRLIRLLVEEGLNLLPYEDKVVETPTGALYEGVGFKGRICGVSIMCSGESMERALRDCCRNIRIGKIIIKKQSNTMKHQLYYCKFPRDIAQRHVFLMDPMIATGGSVCRAVEVLLESGVPENQIIFLNLIATPEGIKKLLDSHPEVYIVTCSIDEGIDAEGFTVPGVGNFGEKYYGTGDDDDLH